MAEAQTEEKEAPKVIPMAPGISAQHVPGSNAVIAYVHVTFPFPWPPQKEFSIAVTMSDEPDKNLMSIQITSLPTGSLKIVLKLSSGATVTGITQRLAMRSPISETVLLSFSEDDGFFVLLGKQPLKSLDAAPSEILEIVSSDDESSPNPYLSFDNPDARQACEAWIKKRKDDLPGWKKIRKHKKQRSPDAPAQDLRNAISATRDCIQLMRDGREYHLTNLLAQLRALIYWQDGNDNHTPLLYRVAASMELPLPVYYVPRHKAIPLAATFEAVDQPTYRVTKVTGSVYPGRTYEEIVDLMQFLQTEVQVEMLSTAVSPGSFHTAPQYTPRVLTIRDALLDEAVSKSAAHYDEGIGFAVDRWENSSAGILPEQLMTVGEITVDLGEYVLRELGRIKANTVQN